MFQALNVNNGSVAPVRDFNERSPGSALDAGWHQIVVERPLWRSGHRARTPGNVSCTLALVQRGKEDEYGPMPTRLRSGPSRGGRSWALQRRASG